MAKPPLGCGFGDPLKSEIPNVWEYISGDSSESIDLESLPRKRSNTAQTQTVIETKETQLPENSQEMGKKDVKPSALAALVQQSMMVNPLVESKEDDYNVYFDMNNRHEVKIRKELR